MDKTHFIQTCSQLLEAYKNGFLGQTIMPEDSNPGLEKMTPELRIAYFTLPMALNYQRDSYNLWKAALKTFNDPKTKFVFEVDKVVEKSELEVRTALLKYKLALQPNKHIRTWIVIAKTVNDHWGSFTKFFDFISGDFLILKEIINVKYKKGFPYLSGPKIFNYWSFIMSTYGGVKLSNRQFIEIAPDTHITQCSVKLGIVTEQEAKIISKEEISKRWRDILEDSDINPIDMHSPLWFWSRNGFIYQIK
ncbi:MAG: hypothetical protein K9L98_01010 [Candidatus Pacebacteria bacterium]|nr:hypothetical protein [Candidatus Paceibacterota bacterium]MCF7862575.1 hypothetical protein [Candidatus Paceibacterota bacterium]